ncbi:hypothetical protein AGMMS50276_11580 [Synergistales bacterium]|nr:hypothetical protein AGMMS50276_11580 [Synergistales bacterium]
MITSNKVGCAFCCGVLMVIIFCFVLLINESKIYQIDIAEIPHNSDIQWWIDSVVTTPHTTKIEGWIFLHKEIIREFTCRFVLYDTRTQKAYIIPSQLRARPDVEEAYNPNKEKRDYNYTNSGLVGNVLNFKLEEPYSSYKIYILYENNDNNFIVDTNRRI